jgi:nucleotide-binding universal stress UspA family protein
LNLIVPLDGSELSRATTPLVCRLVEVYNATPHILYAGQKIDPETMLDRLGVEWRQFPGGVVHQPAGSAAEFILHLANELPQALIVMCTHTGNHPTGDRFGSVTESVLAGNPEKILLVAPQFRRETVRLHRIVLAHDGTPAAAVAIAPAADIAYRAHADAIAVHIAAPRKGEPHQAGCLTAPQYVDQPQHEWPSWTSEFSARLLALGLPASAINFKVMVAGGQPGSELAQFARSTPADMVILAMSGDWKQGMNNVARVVIAHSGCPVMLVRRRYTK